MKVKAVDGGGGGVDVSGGEWYWWHVKNRDGCGVESISVLVKFGGDRDGCVR